MRIGSSGNIAIGATEGTGTGFGLIVDGVISGDGVYTGVDGNGLQIGGMGGTVSIANGIGVSGTIQAKSMDRAAMVRAVYPPLLAMQAGGRPQRDLENVVVATAEGYAFPTNLDSDQPIGTLAPPTQVDIVLDALTRRLTPQDLDRALSAHDERRNP